jgi:hypothetical protein
MAEYNNEEIEKIKNVLLKCISEKRSTMLLFVKACLCISHITNDDHKFSNAICKKLQETYGDEAFYSLLDSCKR